VNGEWLSVEAAAGLEPGDVVRFDHGGRTFAVYRDEAGRLAATDGLCTHAKVHLADGFVFGTEIECPKHNGRFDVHTGVAKGAPACVDLVVHPVRESADGSVELFVSSLP
jgi:3-phenylpropionate/trans-cinnamate dioxygenase ferredoxin subunit